jgi:hypothetical protein
MPLGRDILSHFGATFDGKNLMFDLVDPFVHLLSRMQPGTPHFHPDLKPRVNPPPPRGGAGDLDAAVPRRELEPDRSGGAVLGHVAPEAGRRARWGTGRSCRWVERDCATGVGNRAPNPNAMILVVRMTARKGPLILALENLVVAHWPGNGWYGSCDVIRIGPVTIRKIRTTAAALSDHHLTSFSDNSLDCFRLGHTHVLPDPMLGCTPVVIRSTTTKISFRRSAVPYRDEHGLALGGPVTSVPFLLQSIAAVRERRGGPKCVPVGGDGSRLVRMLSLRCCHISRQLTGHCCTRLILDNRSTPA